MGFWSTVKDIASNVRAEVVTNKQVNKGILDYDRRQEYNKLSQTADEQQQQQLSQQMVSQGIVDPNLYGRYMKKQEEDYVKKLQDPNSEESFQLQKQQGIDAFKTKVQESIKPSYMTGDRWQKEVLSKAVDELTKDYEWTYNNVMDTYKEYKDPELMNTWNQVKGEYEGLISNSAKRFSELIGQGKSYQDAYKQLIDEGKDKANRIVQIQNQLRRKGDIAGITGAFMEAGEGGPLNAMKSAWKTLSNTISAGIGLLGEGVEEGKQALGYYDTLEELSNLGVYKDNEKNLGLKKLQNRAFEVFDGAPQWLPEVAAMFAGNAASNAIRLPELTTAMLRAGRMAPKTAKVSKLGRFVAENMEDFFLYDSIAQASMGRPMTDEDIQLNWMMNIPINAALARLVPTEWMTKTLPLKAINTTKISNGLLSLIKDDKASVKDLATSAYLDFAYRYGTDIEGAGKKILDATGGDIEKLLTATTVVGNDVKELLNTKAITQQQYDKYQEALSYLDNMQKDIKRGKVTIDDMYMLDLGERIQKTQGKNLGIKSGDDAAIKGKMQYDWFVPQLKDIEGERGIYSKTLYRDVNNLVNQGLITPQQYKSIVEELPEGNVGRTILESKYNPQAKQTLIEYSKNTDIYKKPETKQDLYGAYDYLQRRVIEDLNRDAVPVGTNIGYYTYLGKSQNNKPIFNNIFKNTESTLDDVLTQSKTLGASVGGKTETIDRMLSGDWKRGAQAIEKEDKIQLYDTSVIFRGLTEELPDRTSLITKPGVLGETNKILKPFGIKYDSERKIFIGKESGLQKLSNTIKSFDDIGWNLSTISKDQMNAYKVVFAKEYLQAFSNFKKPGKEFYTYFESLFKENSDGTFSINLKYKSSKQTGAVLGGTMKETKDFTKIEQASAQMTAEDAFKDIINGMDVKPIVKKLTNQYEIQGLTDKVEYVINLIKESEDKNPMIKGMSNILGEILGDWKMNEYMDNIGKQVDTLPIYINIISSLILHDDIFTATYLKETAQILNKKGISASPLYEEIIKAREIIETKAEGRLTDTVRTQMMKVLNNQQKLFDAKKIELPDDFYRQYDLAKKNFDGKQISEMSAADIDKLSKNISLGILDRYGIPNESLYKTIYPKISRMLTDFQTEFPTTKLKTKGTADGFAIDVDNLYLHLDDVVSMHTLINLAKQEEFDKYIFNHEAQHLINYKQLDKNIKELANRVSNNIKQIENVSENKNLDSLIFYNKNTLDESMKLLDILSGDDNEMVRRLIDISNTQNVPQLYELMGRIEEAVTEQQALYKTYGYISSKELVDKVKNKLELINNKLDDNTIIDRWNAVAGNARLDKEKILTSTDLSNEAINKPTYGSIKEYNYIPENLTKDFHQDEILAHYSGKETKKTLMRKKTFDYLRANKKENVISISDGLDIFETSTSYIAGGFTRALKNLFPKMKNIDIDNMLIGNATLKKWELTDKTIPLDVFITNKVVANVLSSMGEYSIKTIDDINAMSKEHIINQSLITIKNNPKKYIDNLLQQFENDGIYFKKLSDTEYEELYKEFDGFVRNNFRGEVDNSFYKALEEKQIKQKQITTQEAEEILEGKKLLDEGEEVEEAIIKETDEQEFDYFSYSNEFQPETVTQYVNNMMDDITDSVKLKYDIGLIGKEEPVDWLPYNSLVSALTVDQKVLDNSDYFRNWLTKVKEGKLLDNKLSLIELKGIKSSFQKGLVKDVVLKVGKKEIVLNKQTLSKLSPYKLLNEFIDTLVGENKKMFETVIDGQSHGFSGSYRFWNSIPGKTILEKLNLYEYPGLIYTKHLQPNIGLGDKYVLQSIYDSLSVKKGFDKYQDIFRRFNEFLTANKNMPQEELDKAIKLVLDDIKQTNPLEYVTPEDLKFIKSKASRGINGINKFTKDESVIYSKLQKYLYPTQNYDGTNQIKWLDDIYESKINILTNEGYKQAREGTRMGEETGVKVVAIKPKLDIVDDDLITGTTYSADWISTLDYKGLDYIQGPSDIKGITDYNTRINYNDGEFIAKISTPDGKELNGIAIKDGDTINFIAKEDLALEYKPVKTAEDIEIRNTNTKIIDSNSEFIKSNLVC